MAGTITNEYIFFAGRRIARRDSAANVYYYFADHLGSTRVITSANGTICYDADYFPYGVELAVTNTCPQNYKFTGYERDSETGLDYAFFRYYNKSLGRFMSPDPSPASLSDPQSWNRYTYVGNRPTKRTDFTGQYPQDQHLFITFALAVMAGRPDAAQIAEGAGKMDNFRNAATGLLGFGWIINFPKHFGIPCTVNCPSGGQELGRALHLVEDNGAGGPHQIIQGYGLSNRILSSFAHVGLNLIGKNPDKAAENGDGFAAAYGVLCPGCPYLQGIEDARKTVNAMGLKFVGMKVFTGGGNFPLGDVNIAGARLVSSSDSGGVIVNVYQQPNTNFYDDPNVRAIQRSFLLPGSSPMRESEALYLYQVYGVRGPGFGMCFGWGCGFGGSSGGGGGGWLHTFPLHIGVN